MLWQTEVLGPSRDLARAMAAAEQQDHVMQCGQHGYNDHAGGRERIVDTDGSACRSKRCYHIRPLITIFRHGVGFI